MDLRVGGILLEQWAYYAFWIILLQPCPRILQSALQPHLNLEPITMKNLKQR